VDAPDPAAALPALLLLLEREQEQGQHPQRREQLSRAAATTDATNAASGIAGSSGDIAAAVAEDRDCDATISALRAEIAQYEEEFHTLKNQDVSIRRLEEEITVLQEMQEEAIAAAADLRTHAAMQEYAEKQEQAEKRIHALVEALKSAQVRADKLTQQLLQEQAMADTRLSTVEAENAMLLHDRDRLIAKAVELEQHVHLAQQQAAAEAQAQIARLVSTAAASASTSTSTITPAAAASASASASASGAGGTGGGSEAAESYISTLRTQLADKDHHLQVLRAQSAIDISHITALLEASQLEVETLRDQLHKAPTVEELAIARNQARLLQRIAFNAEEEEEEEVGPEAEGRGARSADSVGLEKRINHHEDASLEQIEPQLIARLRSLETTVSTNRVRIAELTASEANFKASAEEAEKRASESAQMVARLEAFVEANHASIASASASASARGRGSSGSSVPASESNAVVTSNFGFRASSNTSGSCSDSVIKVNTKQQGIQSSAIAGYGGVGHATGAAELTALLGLGEDAIPMVIGRNKFAARNSSSGGGSSGGGRTSSINGTAGGDGNGNMVLILQQQRDRFKDRLTQCEQTVVQLQKHNASLLQEKVQQQQDNYVLYAKLKHSMAAGGGGAYASPLSMKISSGGGGRGGRDMEAGGSDGADIAFMDIEDRYRTEFAQQNSGISNRGAGGSGTSDISGGGASFIGLMSPGINNGKPLTLQTMSFAAGDELVYVTLKTFISTRAGRVALVMYFAAMHVICFVSLFFLVKDVDHGCDLNIDHMKHVA